MTQSMQGPANGRNAPAPKDRLDLDKRDRVLVFAPHPDDESIACGGLLQVARVAGAAVRVVVLTDGDNNPWPQRWIEKRWHIGAAERARWGARRREEAREALRVLDIAQENARFFGMPDLGLTDLLMRADPKVIDSLRGQIDEFAPTLLVLPALSDRHPDHSATYILTRLALAHCQAAAPRLLAFAVHGQFPMQEGICVALSEVQRGIKQAAILAHTSQMRLSQRRFLRYAGPVESYLPMPLAQIEDPRHPLRASVDADGMLRVRIDLRRWRGGQRGQAVYCAIESSERGSVRWLVALAAPGQRVDVQDAVAGTAIAQAIWQRNGAELSLSIALAGFGILRQGYVKLAPPKPGWRVFDRCGWQPLALPERNARDS
jgi:LmbE family N-acetylglucosaminyl deacetylase